MTTIDVLIKALEQSDSSKRHARAERIIWVSQYDITGGVIVGAVEAMNLLREAKLFSEKLLDQADKLRELRNPFAHLKKSDHEHNFGNRYLAQNRHPDLVAEDDAKTALIAMYGHFQHTLKSIG